MSGEEFNSLVSGEELNVDMESQSGRFNIDQLPYSMEQQELNVDMESQCLGRSSTWT